MSEYRRVTRADKHTKRRNNKRKLLFFVGLAGIFIIILFSLIAFGNNDKNEVKEQEEDHTEVIAKDDDNNEVPENNETETDSNDDEQINDDETNLDDIDEKDNVDDVVIQQIESTDENVIEAYSGNWEPIGTVQTGPHTTNYNDDSEDRVEIKRAVSMVTSIDEDNMIEHWVGNGGEQKVISTVSNKDLTELYHVYLSWIDEEGWQVTKVERIKQIEKKATSN